MSVEIINLILLAGSAALGYFLRNRLPQPGPLPGPQPSPAPGPVPHNPLFDLLRLMLERLLNPLPGQMLQLAPQNLAALGPPPSPAEAPPAWAQSILEEIRAARTSGT